MKIVYGYDSDSRVYTGPTEADESPLEEGVWLYPAHTTETEPPEFREGFNRVFKEDNWDYEEIVIPEEPEPEPEPDPVTILYPVDLWTRVTDAEAEAIEAAMLTQSVRLQNIFKSASSYRSDHELWGILTGMTTQLFGAERAAEILAAS